MLRGKQRLKSENAKTKQNSNHIFESLYQFFSPYLYRALPKEIGYTRIAKLESTDPMLGQIPEVCQKDGRGLYTLIQKASILALNKKDSYASCYWYFGPENSSWGQFAMLIINPTDIEWLMKSNIIENSDGIEFFTRFLGKKNIFTMKYPSTEWREERNRHLKLLDDKVISKDLPIIRTLAEDYFSQLDFKDNKASIQDLERFAVDFTLETVAKAKLGIQHLTHDVKNTISYNINQIGLALADQTNTFLKVVFPFLNYLPFYFFIERKLKNLLADADYLLKKTVIHPNAKNILNTHNFITAARDTKKIKLNSESVVNEFKEFLVVGHETTAKLLLFSIMLLADPNHQDFLEKLRVELIERRKKISEFSKDDFDEMPFLNAVLYETLRLYPPVPIMLNKIKTACVFKDTHLYPGDLIFISQLHTHYYEPVWGQDANKFNPERFIDDKGKLKAFNEFMYFPFGFAPRKCVGQKFAMLEVKQLLALMITEFDLRLDEGVHHPFPIESIITLKSAMENIHLHFEKRNLPHALMKL